MLSGTLSPVIQIGGALSGQKALAGSFTVPITIETPPYMGEYNFTPTQEAQTVEISGLRATQNITINPIPQNYGLITWNGATLTVS